MYHVYTITIYDIRKYTIRVYTTTALVHTNFYFRIQKLIITFLKNLIWKRSHSIQTYNYHPNFPVLHRYLDFLYGIFIKFIWQTLFLFKLVFIISHAFSNEQRRPGFLWREFVLYKCLAAKFYVINELAAKFYNRKIKALIFKHFKRC